MSATSMSSQHALRPLDRLVGRPVVDRDGRSAGRIHEFRVAITQDKWVITHYVLDVAGLLERLNVGVKLVLGTRSGGKVARADQVDLSDSAHPRLTCRREQLQDA